MDVGVTNSLFGKTILAAPHSGAGVGGGHVMRCLTLAEALTQRGARVRFAVGPEGLALMGRFEAPFEVLPCRSAADLGVITATQSPDLLLVDSYALDATMEAVWRRVVRRIVVIDDLANRPHRADLIIDPSYGRSAEAYRALCPGATVLAGPQYALVRPEFRAARLERAAQASARIDRIFLSFGLSDVAGITARAVNLTLAEIPAVRIEVAVSADAVSLPVLASLSARDLRVRLHVDAKAQAGLMRGADLAIGAGGSGIWERASIGLANLAVVVADNQRELIERLAAGGYVEACDLSAADFDDQFRAALVRLHTPELRTERGNRLASLCDGRGPERVAEAISGLLAQAGGRA